MIVLQTSCICIRYIVAVTSVELCQNGGYLINFHWFAVVWTLIYHDLRHNMVKMLWTHEASESTANFDHVMT